jgi:ankyrin repeat protein
MKKLAIVGIIACLTNHKVEANPLNHIFQSSGKAIANAVLRNSQIPRYKTLDQAVRNKAIYDAAVVYDTKRYDALLKAGANPHIQDEDGMTAYHFMMIHNW